jgi:hypothetical protein
MSLGASTVSSALDMNCKEGEEEYDERRSNKY